MINIFVLFLLMNIRELELNTNSHISYLRQLKLKD